MVFSKNILFVVVMVSTFSLHSADVVAPVKAVVAEVVEHSAGATLAANIAVAAPSAVLLYGSVKSIIKSRRKWSIVSALMALGSAALFVAAIKNVAKEVISLV